MGDQAGQPLPTVGAKESGTVNGVEAEPLQRRSVPNVMQERSRSASSADKTAAMPRALSATACTWVHRSPNGAINPFCLHRCPLFEDHGATIPCVLNRAQAAVPSA
jgi:hypothetical protein